MADAAVSYIERALETTTTTGAGNITLAGAVTGYQAFSADGVYPYVIFAVDAGGSPTGDWEAGVGTYTNSTRTLARDIILGSSNAGAAVVLAAGTKRVACAPSADKAARNDRSANKVSDEINFINNPDGEDGAFGWVAYADAAGTSPVDATGGAPGITITRSTSSPLDGAASLKITKDAVNRQGEGVSYDFTVPLWAKYWPLQLTMRIKANTGVVQPVAVGIIDVTSGTLYSGQVVLEPEANTSYISRIRTVLTTPYTNTAKRLYIHVRVNTATAFDVYIDSIAVRPWFGDAPAYAVPGGPNNTAAFTLGLADLGNRVNVADAAAGNSYDVTVTTLTETEHDRLINVVADSAMTKYVRLDFGANKLNGNRRYLVMLAGENLMIRCMGAAGWRIESHSYPLWQSYTPTINAVTTNPTKGATRVEKCSWRRDSSDLLLEFFYQHSAAGAAGSGTYLFPLPTPTGTQVDTNVVQVGTDASATTKSSFVGSGTTQVHGGNNQSVLSMKVYDATTLYGLISGSVNATLGSIQNGFGNTNVFMAFQVRIPMQDW
jgi:hypothetical protein